MVACAACYRKHQAEVAKLAEEKETASGAMVVVGRQETALARRAMPGAPVEAPKETALARRAKRAGGGGRGGPFGRKRITPTDRPLAA
jgi:hypothetical protein